MNKLLLIFYFTNRHTKHINMLRMGANGISYLSTKEAKQVAKLDIAEAKREGRVVADDGSVSGSVDSSKNYYRARNQYDITQLPTQYSGNDLTDNPNIGGLVEGRPWVESGVAVPTYEFTTYPTLILEGDTVTCDVATTNVADGTTLYWTIANGTTANGDFSATSGSFTVTSGVGSFTLTTASDGTTEGSETFTVQLRTGSIAGTVRDTTDTITIFEDITDTPIAAELESQFDATIGANFVPSDPADGDTFTQWTENNSGVRNANPIGGAVTRASYETNEANTLSVVRFDGVNDGLSINPYPALASKAGATVFVVIRMAQETVSVNNLDPRVFSTNVANGIALYYDSTSNLWTVAASSGVGCSNQTNDHTLFKMHTLVYDGTLTGNANRLKYRYNGVQDTLTFTGTVGATTNAGIDTLYLGNNNSANYWKGDMGELLIFTRTLTANEILGVEAYLTQKWGL